MGVIGTLADQTATIVSDKLNHASLIDGCRLTRAHSSVTAMATRAMRVSTSKSSTSPLNRGFSSPMACSAWTAISHRCPTWRALRAKLARGSSSMTRMGLAWTATPGRGVCEHFNLSAQDVPVLVGTFGKAFGTFGAFVAGDGDLIEYLIRKSRPYIYTTALPPAVAAATRAALRVSQRESWRREKVLALAERFRRGLAGSFPGIPARHRHSTGDRRRDAARAGDQPGARRERLAGHGNPSAHGARRHCAAARDLVGRARGKPGRRTGRGVPRGARP